MDIGVNAFDNGRVIFSKAALAEVIKDRRVGIVRIVICE